jgi:hypothetical protein
MRDRHKPIVVWEDCYQIRRFLRGHFIDVNSHILLLQRCQLLCVDNVALIRQKSFRVRI